jgi:hypothetical protein
MVCDQGMAGHLQPKAASLGRFPFSTQARYLTKRFFASLVFNMFLLNWSTWAISGSSDTYGMEPMLSLFFLV